VLREGGMRRKGGWVGCRKGCAREKLCMQYFGSNKPYTAKKELQANEREIS